jgi:hypothetical protein
MTDLVLQTHPDYDYKYSEWELCQRLFEARHEIVCKRPDIFWTHAVEDTVHDTGQSTTLANLLTNIGKSQWQRRSLRTRFQPLPEIIASLIISLIFRKSPDFSRVEKLFEGIEKNVDGKGNSLYSFIKNSFALDYFKFGKAIIKVETARHGAVTLADEVGKNVRPYLTLINPLDMPDWELADGQGINNFNWLRYEYSRVKNRKATEKPEMERISKVYTDTGSGILVESYRADIVNKAQTNKSWVKDNEQVLGLSRVPFIVLEDVSWLKDVNQEALRYHNLRSSRDNILYSQGYQKVVVFGVDPNDPAQLQAMSETTWNLVRAPDGSVQAIEPPDLSSHEKALEESLNNIFKIGLNQLRILPSDSRVSQSADSLGEEKDNTIALIESTLEDIENAINETIKLVAEYKGIKDYQETISIEKTFTNADVTKFVTVFGAMRDQFSKYEKVMKYATMKGVRELGLPEDDQAEALKEVEAGQQMESEQDTQRDPLDDVIGEAQDDAES